MFSALPSTRIMKNPKQIAVRAALSFGVRLRLLSGCSDTPTDLRAHSELDDPMTHPFADPVPMSTERYCTYQ